MSQKKNSDSFYFIWSNWNFNVVQKRISEMLTRASSSDMMILFTDLFLWSYPACLYLRMQNINDCISSTSCALT